jgi:hypothetical protein
MQGFDVPRRHSRHQLRGIMFPHKRIGSRWINKRPSKASSALYMTKWSRSRSRTLATPSRLGACSLKPQGPNRIVGRSTLVPSTPAKTGQQPLCLALCHPTRGWYAGVVANVTGSRIRRPGPPSESAGPDLLGESIRTQRSIRKQAKPLLEYIMHGEGIDRTKLSAASSLIMAMCCSDTPVAELPNHIGDRH